MEEVRMEMELVEYNQYGQLPVPGFPNIRFVPGEPGNKWAWVNMDPQVQTPKFELEDPCLYEAGVKLAKGIREYREGVLSEDELLNIEY